MYIRLITKRIVVGDYDVGSAEIALIWREGVPSKLDKQPSFACDINDDGKAVGVIVKKVPYIVNGVTYYKSETFPVLWQNGVRTQLLPDAGTALSINSFGQILVNRKTSSYGIWQNGIFTPIAVRSGGFSNGFGRINDQGSVMGLGLLSSAIPAIDDAFFWKDGFLQKITPNNGGSWCKPRGLNNLDQVVGSYVVTLPGNYSQSHGFIWQNGVFTDLNDLLSAEARADWVITGAVAINDSGVICAHAAYKVTPYSTGLVYGNRVVKLIQSN
jgi:uncharacterized membrane protein